MLNYYLILQQVYWQVRLQFPYGDHPTLLVVDNDADFIRLVERYVASHGWQVIGTPSVDEVFTLLQQERPRAILLDVVIPGRDGWDLLSELKQDAATRDIPVLVCSVLNKPELALSLGAAAYLQKPVDEPRLVGALGPFR